MREGKPLVTVFPALVPLDHPLAAVRNEFNGVLVDSDFLGPSVYEGRGAGGKPTASSVASDLGDLLKSILSKHVCPAAARRSPRPSRSPSERMSSRYYFHFVTANRPGIWALVTGICAEDGINIESVHQKWEDKSKPSDLYVLVDEAEEAQVRQRVRQDRRLRRDIPGVALFPGPGRARGRGAMIDLHTHTFLSDGELGARGAGAPGGARRLPRHRDHRSRGCLQPGRHHLRARAVRAGDAAVHEDPHHPRRGAHPRAARARSAAWSSARGSSGRGW